jgi:guanine nucleotide-binding protein G(I)/G(S)/G(T) subunit beta-1
MNISLHPENTTFVSGSCDHTAITWDIKSGKRIFRYEVCEAHDVNAVSFFPSGTAFASGSEDGHLRLFDIRACNVLNDYAINNAAPAPTSLAFSHSGRFMFASYASEPDCLVWDTLKAERKGQVQGHTKRITSIGVSGDGAALCTASWDAFLKIWT